MRDVAVVGQPDPVYGEAVTAVVVLREGAELDLAGLTTWARRDLAGYKVPTAVVRVAELPVNPTTGKVDRRRVGSALSASRGAA